MSAIETLRAILVGATIVAAVLAAVFGMWMAAVVLTLGVLVHGYATLHLRRVRLGEPGNPPPAAPPAG